MRKLLDYTCSLLSDPLPLVKHIYKLFVDWKAQAITSEGYEDSNYEEEFFTSVSTEAKFYPSKTDVKSLTELALGMCHQFTARKCSLRRLCFYTCLSFCYNQGMGLGVTWAGKHPSHFSSSRYTPRQVLSYLAGTPILLSSQVHLMERQLELFYPLGRYTHPPPVCSPTVWMHSYPHMHAC